MNELEPYSSDLVIAAHKFSIRHRDHVASSKICGCFYCVSVFPPEEIVDWPVVETTALCPRCGIDSVIGDTTGYPVNQPAFLRAMKDYWF